MARLAPLLLLLSLAAIGADGPMTAYLRRVGPFRIGMTLPEMRRLLNDPQAKLDELEGPQCSYVSSNAVPEGMGFMFFYRKLVRIDIEDPAIPTASGARIGDSEEKVLQLYRGRMRVEGHKYGDEGDHYLVFETKDVSDRDYGLVFETFGGKVTTYRIGTKAAITLVEGCA